MGLIVIIWLAILSMPAAEPEPRQCEIDIPENITGVY